VDIADPSFDPSVYGRSLEQLMGTIHGVGPDGVLVSGVEVFRRAYAAVGLGWLLAPTGWPVLRPLFDLAYRAFARVRPMLSRRAPSCDDGRCRPGPTS
jgi:predicted DCC family thiol-disulfide oxidoreductase YuxK